MDHELGLLRANEDRRMIGLALLAAFRRGETHGDDQSPQYIQLGKLDRGCLRNFMLSLRGLADIIDIR